jgi:SAM-dependent methyltransferase
MKKQKEKIKINLGCGIIPVDGFINVDKFYTEEQLKSKKGIFVDALFTKKTKYVQGDMLDLPFKENYADYIETVDAIEHISFRFVLKAVQEMYRVLKPGGKLVIVTTNFNQLAQLWTDTIARLPLNDQEAFEKYKNLMEVIYGNQAYGGEFHTTAFNPQFLNLLLVQAGFNPKKINIFVYPMGNAEIRKKIKTQVWEKNAVCRTEMLLAEVTK